MVDKVDGMFGAHHHVEIQDPQARAGVVSTDDAAEEECMVITDVVLHFAVTQMLCLNTETNF